MCGNRELAFFPGVARGSAFPGFDYETEAGAVAAALLLQPPPVQRADGAAARRPEAKSGCEAGGAAPAARAQRSPALSHGTAAEPSPDANPSCDREAGGAGAEAHSHAPACMQPGGDAGIDASASASRRLGLGQLVQQLMPWRSGAAHAPSESADVAGEALGSDWVVVSRQVAAEAAKCAAGQGAILTDAVRCDRAGSASRDWERCVDYCNGGPVFCPDTDPGQNPTDPDTSGPSPFRVLAEYEDLGGAIAAVRCAVGGGRAVLCGTHPELAPHWLDAACEADGEPAVSAGTAGVHAADEGPCGVQPGGRGWSARAAGVRAALARDGPARQRLWRMLLAEAGLNGLRESGLS